MKKKYIYIVFLLALLILSFLSFNNIVKADSKDEEKTVYVSYASNTNGKENLIKTLQKKYKNKKIIAYLEILNTGIKEPMTQTTDNTYYLSHNLKNKKNIKGTIFLDNRTNINDSSKNIIYGHMSSKLFNTPFSELRHYLDEDYFNNHKFIIITTKDKIYTYQIFGVTVYSKDFDYLITDFKDDDAYLSNINSYISKSLYYDNTVINKDDQTLFIQTCYPKKHGSYIILGAKKVSEENIN
jgi:sortase B